MDRVRALARVNSGILAAYSARTIAVLRDSLPMRLALPHLEPVLVLNLDKEMRKDALVIRHAGAAHAAGTRPDSHAVRRLYLETQAIDRDFIARVDPFPVRLVIPYGEIEPLRTRRIERLAEAAYRTLDAWRDRRSLRAAVGTAYSQPDFERLAHEVFDLYAREVRALGRAVRLPALLAPLRESFAERLLEVMGGAGARLASDLARDVYGPRRHGRARSGPPGI